MAVGLYNQIKEQINITDYAEQIGYTLVKKGRLYSLKEHDSVIIDPDKKAFWRNSQPGVSGSIIDFAKHFGNMSEEEAVSELKEMLPDNYNYYTAFSSPQKKLLTPPLEQTKNLQLPEKFSGYRYVYGYLANERQIDNAVIKDLIDRKMLYESAETKLNTTTGEKFMAHNAVFVGRDYDGVPRYGFRKGTMGKYAKDCPGTIKKYALFVDNKSSSLIINEAIIDSMSVMSMQKDNGFDFKRHNYLAMQGNNVESVKYHMACPENENIKQVIIAVDNDETGDRYRLEIKSLLEELNFKGKIFDKRPDKMFNDFNEQLQTKKQSEKTSETELDVG